jgi:hypothetical protein
MTNDNVPELPWTCLDCQYGGPGASLCRKADGTHTFEVLAAAYLTDRDIEDAQLTDERHRAFDCVGEMVRAAPLNAVAFLVVACAACVAPSQLAMVAAGPLEDLLEEHGPVVIHELERIAKIDPRFRLMLSGTWGRERIAPDVWARLVAAVQPGPVMDADGRTPAAGMSDKCLSAQDEAALFPVASMTAVRH